MRERSNDMRFGSTFPGFRFDLDATLLALGEAGVDITPSDPEAFGQLMQAWRNAASSLYGRHAEETRRGMQGLSLRAEMNAAYERGQNDLGAELQAKFTRVHEPATRTARRILDLHASYVQLVSEQFPSVVGQSIRNEFERTAYKPFVPDSCDLSPFFAGLLENGLKVDQRTRVEEIRDAWRAADQSARQRMRSHYLDWHEKTCTMKSYSGGEYLPYAREMAAMVELRIAGAETAIAAVLDILPKPQRRDAAKQADKWRKAISLSRDERERIKDRVGGWPAPFE